MSKIRRWINSSLKDWLELRERKRGGEEEKGEKKAEAKEKEKREGIRRK